MSHIHSISDKDMHFSIDPVTRQIISESLVKTAVVQYDHNSERFTFCIPRYVEDHDMTTCNRVEVHYKNIDAETMATNQGVYLVEDLSVDPDDENTVVCSWVISQNATQYVGPLEFALRYGCVTDDNVTYLWNTAPYVDFKVIAGHSSAEAVVTKYADILQTWWKKLFIIEGGTVNENTDEALTFWVGTHSEYDALPEEEKNVENRLYFFEDDPSIETLNELIENLRSDVDELYETLGGSPGFGNNSDVMLKSIYDTDGDGVVDSAASLGGSVTVDNVATKDYVAREVGVPLADLRASIGSANGVASLNEDGKVPIEQMPVDGLDDTFLPRSGGAMTGFLVLSGDPVEDMDAATKKYVDAKTQGEFELIDSKTFTPASNSTTTSQYSITGLSEFMLYDYLLDPTESVAGENGETTIKYNGKTVATTYHNVHGKKYSFGWLLNDGTGLKIVPELDEVIMRHQYFGTFTDCDMGIKLYGIRE